MKGTDIRIISILMVLTVAASALPLPEAEGVQSNHIYTRIDPSTAVKPFNPDDNVQFEITFYSVDTTNQVHVNYSAVDSGGDFNLTNWDIQFDKTNFSVSSDSDVVVTITITTNFTTAEKGRYLDLTVWGDVSDPNRNDIDTNASTFRAIIAERDDVSLSVNEANSRKLVYPHRETKFEFSVTNTGWASNSITLTAKIAGDLGHNWTVRVLYTALDSVSPLETRTDSVNITTPEIIPPGDYTLEVTAMVGAAGRDTLDITARVAKPDLRVQEIEPLYNPILSGVTEQIKVYVENDGGDVRDVTIRGEVMGHEGKWVRLPDATISEITNYNTSYAVLTWNSEKTDKHNATETWTVRIILDYLNSIEETNEGNNQATATIEVKGVEKSSVSFDTTPFLLMLGIMLAFSGSVALSARRRWD